MFPPTSENLICHDSKRTSSLDLVLIVQVHPNEDDLGMEDQVLYIRHLFR